MKCERKNAKLEQFEEMVDDIMDWIYDTEFLLTYVVESTHSSVKERTEQFEVRRFLENDNLRSFYYYFSFSQLEPY